MRTFGVLVDKAVRLRQPTIPGARQIRANPPPLSRLDEALTDVFNQACTLQHLEEAADLLAMIERWHAQRPYSDEETRRSDTILRARMRGELERRHIMRGTRMAPLAISER